MTLEICKQINYDNLPQIDIVGKLVAYGEGNPPTDGYIARVQPDQTINGLTIEFILDSYDWVYYISEGK
jgi:hypothetical protein